LPRVALTYGGDRGRFNLELLIRVNIVATDLRILEQRLKAAQERRNAAARAMAPKHKGGEWEEFRTAHAALLVAEREIAAARQDEYAGPLDFPVQWDTGAPLPHVLVNDFKVFLIFCVKVVDPKWDGTHATVKNPASDRAEPLALVEFKRCHSTRLGSPNDEVFHGHALAGKGLDGYTAQVVHNSRWIAEIQKINSVHSGYRPEGWQKVNHYVFWFHDTTFECIAESFHLELRECSMPELLADACRRLVE
jgi:hypothetical protein